MARLARELSVSCQQLHTLRQRIQAHLNATASTGVMTGTALRPMRGTITPVTGHRRVPYLGLRPRDQTHL